MKKRSIFLFVVMAIILGTSSMSPAQGPTVLTVNIPFEFTIGKSTLPAGEYDVKLRETGGNPFVSVRSKDGESFGMVFSNAFKAKKADATIGLTFIVSGDRHYLYQVYVPGREVGHEAVGLKKLVHTEVARRTVGAKPVKSE